jgi:hypothetical protein
MIQMYHTFFLLHVSAWWGHLQACLGALYNHLFFATPPPTGQCSHIGSGDCTEDLNIPEDGPIRPKHVVGKTHGTFVSLTNCVDGEYNK